MNRDIICGLDIGVSSIRTLIAQPMELCAKDKTKVPFHDREKILGLSESPTKGFSKGVVTNLGLLSDAIEDALSKAEAQAHCRIKKVITNISGVHIRQFKSRGSIHVSDRPSEITEEDLTRCIESARLIAMSLDREVVHLVPERFYIDDKMEINDPVGLFGSKLDCDLNIITSLVSILQNLTKAINLAGYEVEDVVVSGAATGRAIFDQKELEDGAVIIDVGKDLTEVTVFMDGKLSECFYFPFGSDDLTQVLQDKLRIMFEEAEALRIRNGIVRPGSGHGDTQSDRERLGGNWVDSEVTGARTRLEISNLLFPKVEEIMQHVHKKIEPFLKQRKKLPHIRIVGGVSKMDGFIEAIEEIFSVPVHMGRIRDAKDLSDVTFACALGLTRFGACERTEKKSKYVANTNSFAGRLISRIQSMLSEYF